MVSCRNAAFIFYTFSVNVHGSVQWRQVYFTQIGSGNRIELTSFVAVLLMLCVYTMIFGRFFCGFACAFGSFGDAVHAIYVSCCRKLNKKPVSIPAKAAKSLHI